jgi:hypothetical protein
MQLQQQQTGASRAPRHLSYPLPDSNRGLQQLSLLLVVVVVMVVVVGRLGAGV